MARQVPPGTARGAAERCGLAPGEWQQVPDRESDGGRRPVERD